MTILAIESAALTASAAVVNEEMILAETTLNTKLTHSQTLLPMIDEILRRTEIGPEEIDAVAVSAGPGSFTGLRIGAATAKGLGMAWDKPLIAVPTLDAMAYGLWGSRFLLCPIMDARRSQVYNGLYRFDGQGNLSRLVGPRALGIGELLAELKETAEPVVFLGDGVPVFRAAIEAKMGDQALFAPPSASRQRASAVAALGLEMLKRGETVTAAAFAPFYLRISQAERERARRLTQEQGGSL
ncbi:MAG: tRNA (adenosine(37)-N6)-threonylcarbamoyltransferase complex dimerization subunit type 1 TsaB [Lachnospiraceae bacterium]|nr:tRNA (adenosine(37)-N6)-threonylcarbamoyltransferase complex dimerization subunit type 1 TsaB [Lachnospiraceae bacterium]